MAIMEFIETAPPTNIRPVLLLQFTGQTLVDLATISEPGGSEIDMGDSGGS